MNKIHNRVHIFNTFIVNKFAIDEYFNLKHSSDWDVSLIMAALIAPTFKTPFNLLATNRYLGTKALQCPHQAA